MRWPKIMPGRQHVWNDWFAWRPVSVGNEWVWLETVMRTRSISLWPIWRYINKDIR